VEERDANLVVAAGVDNALLGLVELPPGAETATSFAESE